MSVVNEYAEEITLLDRTEPLITPVSVDGDATKGNLNEHRSTLILESSGIKKTRNGTLTLRCPDGLFLTKEPILVDKTAEAEYWIDARIDQPDGAGGTRTGEQFRCRIWCVAV